MCNLCLEVDGDNAVSPWTSSEMSISSGKGANITIIIMKKQKEKGTAQSHLLMEQHLLP